MTIITNPIGIDGTGYFYRSIDTAITVATGAGTNNSGDFAYFNQGVDFSSSYAVIDGLRSNLFTLSLGTDGFLALYAGDGSEIAQANLIATLVDYQTVTQPGSTTTYFVIDPPPASATPEAGTSWLMALGIIGVLAVRAWRRRRTLWI